MIRYFHPGDEDQLAAQAPIAFDEDTAWWAGVQRCGARFALVAVLAATALSTAQANSVDSYHQDDPAGQLFGQYDEDYWENPVFPVQAPKPPIVFTDDDVVVPQPGALQVDELYWDNAVAPLPGRNLALYLPDAEEIPAASLFGQPDEDFWQNPVRPVPATLVWPNPAQFEQHDPAGSLFGQADEDFWSPLATRWAASNPRLFSDDDVLPTAAAPAFVPDEDYWASSLGPSTLRQVSAFSDDDLWIAAPASPALDEDFWQLARAWTRSTPAIAFLDDSVVVPQPVPLHTDEDFWIAPPARVWPPAPKLFADDDIIVPQPPGPFSAFAALRVTQSLIASRGVATSPSLWPAAVATSSSLAVAKFTIESAS